MNDFQHLRRIGDSEEKIEKAAEELRRVEVEEARANREMHRMQKAGGGLWRRKSATETEIRAQMREVANILMNPTEKRVSTGSAIGPEEGKGGEEISRDESGGRSGEDVQIQTWNEGPD